MRSRNFASAGTLSSLPCLAGVLRDDFPALAKLRELDNVPASHRLTLSHLLSMQEEIEHLFDRSVDLVEKKQLKNPYRRSNAPGTRSLDGKQERERRSARDIAIIPAGVAHPCSWDDPAQFIVKL